MLKVIKRRILLTYYGHASGDVEFVQTSWGRIAKKL